MDSNGYNQSIMQEDQSYCYVCGRRSEKLDRHEVFFGPYRDKSKELGLWVMLCHMSCHLYGVHGKPKEYEWIKENGQRIAMKRYGWTKEDFIREFGRSYAGS